MLIGKVTALTGIAAGRIRHYEKIGLLQGVHLSNGYRVFDVDQVLKLLRIDLLRSLGVGMKDIHRLLDADQGTALVDVLNQQRAVLVRERDRLDRLVDAIDAAVDTPDDGVDEPILRQLATSHRNSIGVIGRLSVPLAAPVTAMYANLFDRWKLPVPALFGQMVLPPAASTLLEELSRTPGRRVLFDRLRALADDVVALGEDNAAARTLAHSWIERQLADPWPDDVARVLRGVQPLLDHDPVIVQGFRTWAASIAPGAADFVDEMARETARRALDSLSVIVLPVLPVLPAAAVVDVMH